MSRTLALEAALRRSNSCYVGKIRERIGAGVRPIEPVRLVDDAKPPIAMIEWPAGDSWPTLFIALDKPAEVQS